jgi:hypothetical protein
MNVKDILAGLIELPSVWIRGVLFAIQLIDDIQEKVAAVGPVRRQPKLPG